MLNCAAINVPGAIEPATSPRQAAIEHPRTSIHNLNR